MSNYVELVFAKRALYVAGAILGLMILAALAFRIDISWSMSVNGLPASFNNQLSDVFMMAGLPMGLLIATLLAGPLAKENDGHYELAWTKPVSRTRYALATIAIDYAAILLSVFACVAVVLGCIRFFGPIGLQAGNPAIIGLALLAPLAFHAALNGFGASLQSRGRLIGLGWVAAIFIPGIAEGLHQLRSIPLALVGSNIFKVLSYFDPIAYVNRPSGSDWLLGSIRGTGTELLIIAALIVAYTGAALLQWRRVEF